jgi:hypothetical protein
MKTRTAVKYFADPPVTEETTDEAGFLARVADLLQTPLRLARPVAVSFDGKPVLVERVHPLTWRLSYDDAAGEVKHRFVQTTNPLHLTTEALRISADLAAQLGVGYANVVALATI